MANNQLFKDLCRPEIIKIGWHLAQGDSRDDFVRDSISHADYASNLSERLLYLIKQIQSHRYRPRHLVEVDVPKSGLSVRPGNVLPIEEASILHAVIYLLAPKLDKKLDPAVYSYRLHADWEKKAPKGQSMFREVEIEVPFLRKQTIRALSPFEAWYERWPAFEKDAKSAYEKEGFSYLTKTDIFSFFEHIDLRLLHDLLGSSLKTEESKILQLLFRILGGWSRLSSSGMPLNRGIPQGNDVSSFLGNIYLIPLDRELNKFCRRKNAQWFRYVDDVKVYTHSEADAREVVFVINNALREMHLNLQGSKTEILSGEKLKQEHDESKLERVNEVFDKVRSLSAEKKAEKKITTELKNITNYFKPFTTGLPESVRGLKGKENRLFRRLLTTYGIAGRSRKGLYDSVFAAISELPDLRVLRSCLTYLSRQNYNNHGQITERLLATLEKGELLFPYQIASVLEIMVQLHPEDPKTISSRVRRFALGRNLQKKMDWLIIQKALETIMTFPYKEEYITKIPLYYVNHNHPMVRRAATVILSRAPKKETRKYLRDFTIHPDFGVSRLAQYLERLCNERDFAPKELANLRRSKLTDVSMVRRLPQLYAASATEDIEIAREVYETLKQIESTKSAKLQWHHKMIANRIKWIFADRKEPDIGAVV